MDIIEVNLSRYFGIMRAILSGDVSQEIWFWSAKQTRQNGKHKLTNNAASFKDFNQEYNTMSWFPKTEQIHKDKEEHIKNAFEGSTNYVLNNAKDTIREYRYRMFN